MASGRTLPNQVFERALGAAVKASAALRQALNPEPELESLQQRREGLVAEKQAILDRARTSALAEGRTPTLTDYYSTALKSGMSVAVMSDMTSLRFDGFLIRREDMTYPPSPEARDAMLATVQGLLAEPGVNREALARQLGGTVDMFDQDGDQIIHPIYQTIENQRNFTAVVVTNSTIRPSTTLFECAPYAKDDKGVQDPTSINRGARFENVVFDGLGDDAGANAIVFTRADYRGNITLTNVDGGRVEFGPNTVIPTFTMSGRDGEGARSTIILSATADIGREGGFNAEEGRLVVIHAQTESPGPGMLAMGATISHANLKGAILSPMSSLHGTRWEDAHLEEASLAGVDMSGARINGMYLTSRDALSGGDLLKDLNLEGAVITNLVVDGKPITTPDQLRALGIIGTPASIRARAAEATLEAPARAGLDAAAKQAAYALGAALKDPIIQTSAPAAEAEAEIAAGWTRIGERTKPVEPTRIEGGVDVASISEALQQGANQKVVAELKPVQDQGAGIGF